MNNLSEIGPPSFSFRDFNISDREDLSRAIFRYQYAQNEVYRCYCDQLWERGVLERPSPHGHPALRGTGLPTAIGQLSSANPSLAGLRYAQLPTANRQPPTAIYPPFLPIRFFKSHNVTSGTFLPEVVFESSGTTQTGQSRHLVRKVSVYEESFMEGFRLFYGDPSQYVMLALLPSYLERGGSSLVYMADALIRASGRPESGFYLNQFDTLAQTLQTLEAQGQQTILLGVTFALLDFAEAYPLALKHTIVMETGGMKGRKRELTREEVHGFLKERWGLEQVHAEYGMTELLSQAYSTGGGRFRCPPWMQIVLRAEDDPFALTDAQGQSLTEGLINIIDLANIHSCAFIATDDLGRLHPDGSFEVLGRMDNADIRGCSLLTA